jgi:hypothetical protein
LKKFVAIFVAVGILLQTFSQVVIVAQYYANKDFIAKNLCENKDKPQMHCEGKCCLKKKLAKDGREQSPSSPRNQKNEQVNLFYSDLSFGITARLTTSPAKQFFSFNDNRTSSFISTIFHPPGTV